MYAAWSIRLKSCRPAEELGIDITNPGEFERAEKDGVLDS